MRPADRLLSLTTAAPTRAAALALAAALGLGPIGIGPGSLRAADAPRTLPLKKVVMVNTGLGYFEHADTIEGNRQVEIAVDAGQINDVIKSLVVRDDGGKVGSVQYRSPEPVDETLRALSVDISANPSLAQIFHQLRGQPVSLKVRQGKDDETATVEGTVAGVERRRRPVALAETADQTTLLLLQADGEFRTVPVDDIRATKFLNEAVNRDVQKALRLLGNAPERQKKAVRVDFLGEKARDVRLAYVQDAPLWKTTYRLVLGDDDKPFLQGWAIVENTTPTDWEGVELTLLGGHPVSFQMDLYSPLFATRPTLPVQAPVTAAPRTYAQSREDRVDEFLAGGRAAGLFGGGGGGMGGGMGGMGGFSGGFFGGGGGMGGGSFGGPEPGKGVETATAADTVGESFRFTIKTPVTLAAAESAMFPIVNDPVTGERLAIYHPGVHPRHPLAGLRLKNSTEVHWQAGPLTIFDGGEYAGDAQLLDIAPGDSRLISYALAVDLDVAVAKQPLPPKPRAAAFRNAKLEVTSDHSRVTKYSITNASGKDRDILVEQDIEAEWSPAEPKPRESTPQRRRYQTTAKANATTELAVVETRPVTEQTPLGEIDEDFVRRLDGQPAVAREVVASLRKLLTLRKAAEAARKDVNGKRDGVKDLVGEQERLRDSLRSVAATDALRERYLQKLNTLEDDIEKARDAAKVATDKLTRAEQDLATFTESLGS